MPRSFSAILFIVSLAASAGEPFLTVKGEATERIAPDFLVIDVSLVAIGPDAARLKEDVDARAVRVFAAAAANGVANSDLRSSGVSVGQNLEYDRNENEVPRGYVVGRELKITLRAIDRYELLAQALVDAGVEKVEVEVAVDDKTILRQKALAAAARDARRKAAALADELGVIIGTPIEIGEERLWYDQSLGQRPRPDRSFGEVAVTGSRVRGFDPLMFVPEDIEVNAEMWVRFLITPKPAAAAPRPGARNEG